MIEELKRQIQEHQYVSISLTKHGDGVSITATVKTADGTVQKNPIQLTASFDTADALLAAALQSNSGTKKKEKGIPEKGKKAEPTETEDLFAGA